MNPIKAARIALALLGAIGIASFVSQSIASEPVWDGNKVQMTSEHLAPGVFAFYAADARVLNAKGGAAATSGGLIVGTKATLLIETMLNRRLHDQVIALARKASAPSITYALNTSAHGDHSFGNMYLPATTKLIQHVNARKYIESNFEDDKAFMIKNFGAGRGIEPITPRTGDLMVAPGGRMSIDLGGKLVEIIDFGFAQTGGDLFVWEPAAKVLWTGNAIVAPKPALPWLLDGHLLETLDTLNKVYAFLPSEARIIPGHGTAMRREDLKWHIDYLAAVKQGVETAIAENQSLEQTVKRVALPEFRGYALFDWVHPALNVPAAFKDLAKRNK
jgi:cyclase